ncbi:MAG: circularly permuted type 2 ATP-grasp protein, partial [Alphaproteobacteria bacterium]|nr:circularly permuted type 2 ATP-grasp protein [Alphaproteobacteria bacterium]
MSKPDGSPRAGMEKLYNWLMTTPPEQLQSKQKEAEALFRRIGITFAVYGEGGDPETLIPVDMVPRVITAKEWDFLSRGLEQRVKAINMFLHDVYHDQNILKAGIIPEELVLKNKAFLPEMHGVDVSGQIYTHIAGIDLVRTGENEFFVLEDNARTPSGVSYMLQNREVMMRVFPDLFDEHDVAPVDRYTEDLLQSLKSVAPADCKSEPTVVVLSPGLYNSAYYEHTFLADKMGVELVEGQDLFVDDNKVFMRTTHGPQQVDVIYKRLDDDFIDPLAFNPDSFLGVPGLMNVYRSGGVTLANAVGCGIADDKAIYMYIPDIIKFYLDEEAILKNVPTYWCAREDDYKYVMDHLDELVVKEVDGSGGYGMLVGPAASEEERIAYGERIKKNPGEFIAQPTLALSTSPTFVNQGYAPRHIDLRPFVLVGADRVRITP